MTIERAIVVDKIDLYHYKVRIPTLNKSEAAVGSTPNRELYTACVSSSPGIIPAYNTGNAVYVGFEYSDSSAPVILGALLNDSATNIQSNIYATSLTVSIDTHLSSDTHIGKVTPDNIATLEGQSIRIKSEFERVDALQAETQTSIREINNTIIYMQEHDEKADADAVRLAKRVTDNEHSIQTNAGNISSHSSNTVAHVTQSNKNEWNDAYTKRHTHSNKSELDKILSGDKAKWDDAHSKRHTHANATELAKIESGDKSRWDGYASSKANASHNHTSLTDVTRIIFTSASYGTADPPASATKGQIYFKLEE